MKIIFELLIFGIVTSLSAPLVHGAVAPPADEPPPAFNNVLTDELLVNCPCGYALHRVRSKFDGGDRRWLWECKKISEKVKDSCIWYRDINELQDTIVFRCPKREYMAGIQSSFTGGADMDRVWAVKCCKTAGICLTECRLSDPINNLGDAIDYCADDGNVFVGVYSSFFSVDRIWWIEECRASRCPLFPGIDIEYYAKRSEKEEEHPDPAQG